MTTRQAEKPARVVSRQEILDRASRHLGLPTHAEEEAAKDEFEGVVLRLYLDMLLALARAKRMDLLLPMLRACRKTVAGRSRSSRLDALASFLASVDGVPTECLVPVAMYLLPTVAPWLVFKSRTPYPRIGLPHPSTRALPSCDDLCKTEKERPEKPAPTRKWEPPEDDAEPSIAAQTWLERPTIPARMSLLDRVALTRQLEALAAPHAADPDEIVTTGDALIGTAKRAAKGSDLRDHARFLWKLWTKHFHPPVKLPEPGSDPREYGRQLVRCAARSLGVPENGIRSLFEARRQANFRKGPRSPSGSKD